MIRWWWWRGRQTRQVFLDVFDGLPESLNTRTYSDIFTNKSFWLDVVRGEKLLVFQTDTVLCRPTDLSELFEYDW